jgi:putative ABC transport system permease protein
LFIYTSRFLWRERQRFLSAMLAVACSAALVNVQVSLALGIFSATSIPIDYTEADVWVGAPGIPSVDAGLNISEDRLARVAGLPEVARVDTVLMGYMNWTRPDGSRENVLVVGSRLTENALGTVQQLSPAERALLAEPGSVIIDRSERRRLGVTAIGETVEVGGTRVRIVGWVRGLRGLNGAYLFCSQDTARQLLHSLPDQVTYLLVQCHRPDQAASLTRRLGAWPDLSAHTSAALSFKTQVHWLTKTPGGLVTVVLAILSLLAGAMITRQALYGATIASVREYALLRALGIPARNIAWFVLSQSLGVGIAGILAALPIIVVVGRYTSLLIGMRLLLPWWLLCSLLTVTLLMAILSGLATLRSLRLMEPATLLR